MIQHYNLLEQLVKMNWNIDTQSLGAALKGTMGPSTIAERFNCLSFTTTTTKLYTNIYIITVLMFIPSTISQFECFIRISSNFFWIMLWLHYLQKTSEITSIFVMIQRCWHVYCRYVSDGTKQVKAIEVRNGARKTHFTQLQLSDIHLRCLDIKFFAGKVLYKSCVIWMILRKLVNMRLFTPRLI